MAEQSKFSGALAKLNQRPVEPQPAGQGPRGQGAGKQEPEGQGHDPQSETPAAITNSGMATLGITTVGRATVEKGRGGRPTGKRSDPDFQQTTLLLRKETKKKAVRQLEDSGAKTDLSELVEQLLTNWTDHQM